MVATLAEFSDVRQIQIRLLKIISFLVLLAVPTIWVTDWLFLHHVTVVDQVGYPCLILSFAVALVVLSVRPSAYPFAAILSIGTGAFYMGVYLQAVMFGFSAYQNLQSVSTFAQWLPLVYISLFLFLQRRPARILSIAVYLSFAISLAIQAAIDFETLRQHETFPLMVHILGSHPLYIVTLSWVETVQRAFVTSQEKLNSAEMIAYTDYLTGIANRRGSIHILRQSIADALRASNHLAILLLDVDHFKRINDTYGHDVGDQVLVAIAKFVAMQTRETDTLGRWGGEEFIVVLPSIQQKDAQALAERICRAIAQHSFPVVGNVTVSLGLACLHPNDTLDSLTKRADVALYQAKDQGRNRVQCNP